MIRQKNKSEIKKYESTFREKAYTVLENYEFGMPIIESLKDAKFQIINNFADRLILFSNYPKNFNKDQDFVFTMELDSKTLRELKIYLKKHKDFLFDYTVSKDNFIPSYLYQLYLQYVPYILTEVEKNVFLDAYISMLTEIKGSNISNQKRKRLEDRLSINTD